MASAVSFCNRGGALREAAMRYKVALATLSRRVHGSMRMGCKPGPDPAGEEQLVSCIMEMSDMGLDFLIKISRN